MRPDSSFINQPIRSLQTMLRVIAKNDNVHPTLVPDGIYGPQTVRAVSIFQRTHGIPVTGVTDNATWDAIWRSYEPALVEQAEAAGLHIMLNPGQVIRKGESIYTWSRPCFRFSATNIAPWTLPATPALWMKPPQILWQPSSGSQIFP